jgi:short-subunit dehydrogenase
MSNQKVIIITGASRGIGLAISKALLKDGHKLVLVARTAEPMEKLKAENAGVGAVEVFTGDLKSFEVCMSMSIAGLH